MQSRILGDSVKIKHTHTQNIYTYLSYHILPYPLAPSYVIFYNNVPIIIIIYTDYLRSLWSLTRRQRIAADIRRQRPQTYYLVARILLYFYTYAWIKFYIYGAVSPPVLYGFIIQGVPPSAMSITFL